jgi:hypothetical protein
MRLLTGKRPAAVAGAAALVAAFCLLGVTAAAATRDLQHVTLIGDSVADAIGSNSAAAQILSQELDVDLELAPCRRLAGTSCPYMGSRAPTVVDLVHSMGSKLGANVIVAVGYNDFEDQYAQNIETVLDAFQAAGVKHVWWLTLRAARHPYLTMNDDIEAAAQKHPELSVIDWNVYSRSHPDWFQDDGLHLLGPGSLAMATLIHRTLLWAGVAAPPVQIATSRLQPARRGKPYHARLVAKAGDPPYRWSLLAAPPQGLHLLVGGTLQGRARAKPGRYVLRAQVKDADGVVDTRTLTLRVER